MPLTDLTSNKPPIRVCIVDDEISYRNSLKKILEEDKHIWLYSEYDSGSAFIKEINSPFKPDVCLIDVVLKNMSGLECTKVIKEKKGDIHIIIMTAYPDEKSFMEARKLGADYVEKGTRIESLLNKIIETKESAEQKRIISLKRDDKLKYEHLELAYKLNSAKERMKKLTKTETKILKMKKKGLSFDEIAKKLGINSGTVRTHLSKALRKIDLPDLLDYIMD